MYPLLNSCYINISIFYINNKLLFINVIIIIFRVFFFLLYIIYDIYTNPVYCLDISILVKEKPDDKSADPAIEIKINPSISETIRVSNGVTQSDNRQDNWSNFQRGGGHNSQTI